MQIIGLDLGKGYTKAYNGSRLVTFPSVVGHPEKIKYTDTLALAAPSPAGIHLETSVGEFYVGDQALNQSSLSWTMMDRSAVADRMKLVLTLAALSELNASGPIRLVTGVPINWYDKKDAVADLLQGEHTYTRNGKKHTIVIEEVSVVTEPHGTAFSYTINENGQLINPALAGGMIAVIDVGTHTINMLGLNKLGYIEPASRSTANGMAQAYEIVGREIQNRYGLQDLETHAIDKYIRAGKISVAGHEHSLADIVDPILDGLARKTIAIATAMPSPLWKDGGQSFLAILISGGGAHHLGSYLARTYGHADILAGAATANVRGFYNAGQFKWRDRAPKPTRRRETRIKQNGAVAHAD